ncbi:quinone oxidoreductase family protein [Nitrospira moscoviensis]|uniref:Oxidoreductase, zinc-binding dehydrogenase family n=1 Tax=Nitrospira moscoviensis TaxID=42253 RepID=A0A0K2G6C0_NITMO|nr:zinc-binding alcohol dehydrogenase family protein [Nitrospira moscoviensis]ALA56511.1 Oxidoreductase, zinc-binding dehydrogenase family [Nitrospira moscoviensis]
MRAWLMDSYEGVERLRFGEAPDPEPGPADLLLKVRLAALNPADAFLAKGLYPAKPPLPHILGRDGVGEVIAGGAGVEGIRPGEMVGVLRCDVGVERWGTLAEQVVVPADSVARVPQGWSLEEMAGAPLVFLTAWQALTQWTDPPAPPLAGSVLLVTGASGGVGVAAVLLGKSMKLTVVALSRNAGKRAKLKQLGADHVLDPTDTNLVKGVTAALKTRKVDLAVDSVGGGLFPHIVALMNHGGRISVVGRSGGPVLEFNTATLLFRRVRLGGVSVGDYGASVAQAVWNEIAGRLNAMGMRPQVDSIVPFEQVKEGFARLAQGPMGKILVRVAQ